MYKPKLVVRRDGNGVVINDTIRMEILYGDNIMVLEDAFQSSYDCKVCKGTGKVRVDCQKCSGQGKNRFDTDCSECDAKGFIMENCEACHGKGALLEIPEIARGRPTSGIVVSRGADAKFYELGTRVAYTSFTGNLIPLRDNNRLRVMRQIEPMCVITSVGEGSEDLEFVDTDTPYEMR